MSKLYRFLCPLAAALTLAACGGGGGSADDGPVLDGGVVKGPVLGAAVCVYALTNGAKGTQLTLTLPFGASGSLSNGCYVTPANGSYNFRLPRGSSGDVLIESTGGTFCSNEVQVANGACAGGTLINLGAAVMTSAATLPAAGGSSTIYTTPLTTAAVNAAGGANFTAARFNAQFATLAGQVMGNASITPSTPPTTTTQAYLTQVSTYLQGGGSLTNAVSSLAQGTTTFTATSTGNGTTSPATVHASFVGTHNLQFDDSGAGCGSACSYTSGQLITVTIGSDGSLSIPGKILTNPFYRHYGHPGPHTPEIIWLDTAANVEYALSDNSTGTFNEINVGNAALATGLYGMPAFIGQLRAPVVAGAVEAQLAAWAGTYTIAYQYRGATVPWTSMTLAADGAITFSGGAGPAITAANIVTKYDRLACCDRIDLELNIDLNSNADGVNSGDKISLYRGASSELYSIEYDKGNSTVLNDDTGVRLGTVLPLAHDGTAVPVAEEIRGTIGGTAMNFAISFASVNNNFMSLEAEEVSGGTPRTVLLQVSPGAALAQNVPYSCRTSPTANVRVNARTVTSGTVFTTDYGGRCTIILTRIVSSGGTINEIEGTFTGDLMDFKPSPGPKTVTNGVFHWVR